MQITSCTLQGPPHVHKGGHPLQSHTVACFAKDGLPCVCMMKFAVVQAWFPFPAKSTIVSVQLSSRIKCTSADIESWQEPSCHHLSLTDLLPLMPAGLLCRSPHWLVVKVSALRAADLGFDSRLWHGDFSGSSHASDFKIGTPVATLPCAWRYSVSTTGWPGVRILWLGEVESLICNLYLSVAARKIVWADPSLRYTSMLLGR